jgi:hypothetical protein
MHALWPVVYGLMLCSGTSIYMVDESCVQGRQRGSQ